MRHRSFIFLVLLALIAPATANAAPSLPTPHALHVQLSPASSSALLLLESVEYAPETPLPIPVKMAIPKGARVSWAGEILGGDVSKDITASYKVNPKKDYDEVAFTLSKARSAQVEADWSGVTSKNGTSQIKLAWVQRYPAEKVDFGFKAPAQDSVVKMTPAWRNTGRDGDGVPFYVTEAMSLPVGKKLDVTVSYTGQPSATPQQGQSPQQGQTPTSSAGPSNNAALMFVVVIVGGGAIAMTIFAKARKQ